MQGYLFATDIQTCTGICLDDVSITHVCALTKSTQHSPNPTGHGEIVPTDFVSSSTGSQSEGTTIAWVDVKRHFEGRRTVGIAVKCHFDRTVTGRFS